MTSFKVLLACAALLTTLTANRAATRRRQFRFRGGRHEDQPERAPVPGLAVSVALDHAIKRQWPAGPLALSDFIPTADLQAAGSFGFPLFPRVNRRHRARVIEFDLSLTHPGAPKTLVGGRRQIRGGGPTVSTSIKLRRTFPSDLKLCATALRNSCILCNRSLLVFVFHATNIALEKSLRGELSSPLIV